jgi:hypothetical protein
MAEYSGNRLEEILNTLFTDPERLSSLLKDIDREVLIRNFIEILELYANDVNSSTLRELITTIKAGYKPQPSGTKLGYNGETPAGCPCEVKPVNIRSKSGNKLNGGGNFSDFTYERLDRYQKDKVIMLISGFVDAHLIYILEFPLSYPMFVERLSEQLERHFARGHRAPGQFLRSAQFSFRNYKNCPQLKIIYKSPKLNDYQRYLTGELFSFLQGE